MYNPYAQQGTEGKGQDNGASQSPYLPQQQTQHVNQFQQPQHQQHAQQGIPIQPGQQATNMNFNTFFNDPAAQMGLQFSQSAFNASQQYMQNNLQQFVSNEDIKYYFKVSNSYVLKKLFLILFPYKNKSWTRQVRGSSDTNSAPGTPQAMLEAYATPVEDVNAPDLYIPTMAFMTYILVWALSSGIKGDFHPQMLGYATTRTLAFYMIDVVLLKISFYVLGISSKNSKIWDLVSYSGYKFVPILFIMILKNFSSSILLNYAVLLGLCFSFGFFLMRSLKYVVLPSGLEGSNMSTGSKRIRTQYLFGSCFLVQAVLVWLMT